MKMQYIPSKDELILQIHPVKGRPNKELNHFKLWWDDEGTISAIGISNYTEELKEFKRSLNIIQLCGIWKEEKITEEDIKATREELLKNLEEKL